MIKPFFFSIEKEKAYSCSWKDVVREIKKNNLRVDYSRLRKGFDFALKAHRGQRRLSGEAFIHHPLYVALLASKLRLDEESIISALLHDVIEEGEVCLEEIEKEFGLEIALIVDGLTKMRKATQRFALHEESVDDFRKMLLAGVEDVRVLILRLCDKFHNGLTVGALPPRRRRRFAQRLFHLYAPLAEYIGLGYFKRELDDIAFSVLYPKEYQWLKRKLKMGEEEREKRVTLLMREIKKILRGQKIAFEYLYGRRKGYYSIWNKIQRYLREGRITSSDPEVVLDQIGVTVICRDIPSCYAALGAIHSHWEYLPEAFDDYISRPKPNGYRAIQTTIKIKKGTAEVQIKTVKMHEYNEFGPASHIAYKAAGGKSVADFSYSWVKELFSWQGKKKRKNFRIKVFDQFVFVVTPKGDIIRLEKGSTPLDFAYRIHTRLGNYCQGAKVNGKIVRLSHKLNNGDLVEIIKGKKSVGPRQDWLSLVKMEATKRIIRRELRRKEKAAV